MDKISKPRQPSVKKKCCACPPSRADQPLSQFYKSYSKMHNDGLIPMCKTCIFEKCFNEETDTIDVESFKNILRQVDKPFITNAYQSAINQYNKNYEGKRVSKNNKTRIIGYYFKNINSLPQFCALDWNGGLEYEQKQQTRNGNGIIAQPEKDYETSLIVNKSQQKNEEVYTLDDEDNFEVTKDIVRLFGDGYTKSMYKKFWDKYDFLSKNYPDVTNLHTEALVTYVRFKVREEIATLQGDVVESEKWGNAATKAAEKAKINPSQLSKSDLQGGLNSFSELSLMVEQAVDIIPILPVFKFRPNDAIDFNIWCLINYIRDLEGKPICEYEDVYHFYDERKAEYISQYGDPTGIFADDTTESNRETIKKFITLPNDYNVEENIEGDDDE